MYLSVTSYLFLGNPHVTLDPGEDSGFHKEAFLSDSLAAYFQLGSLGLPGLNQLHDLVKLLLVDLRTAENGRAVGDVPRV